MEHQAMEQEQSCPQATLEALQILRQLLPACHGLGSAAGWEGAADLSQPRGRPMRALTLGVVLGVKPLPAALVVAQRHARAALAASFTASTELPWPPPGFGPGPGPGPGGVFAYLWRQPEAVIGEQAKDGYSSSAAGTQCPRYLQRHFCPTPAPGRGNGRCSVAPRWDSLHLPAPGTAALVPPQCSGLARGNPQLL